MQGSHQIHRFHATNRQKNRLRALLYSKVGIVIIGILLFVAFDATWGVYGKYKETQENREIVSRELKELKGRGETIRQDIARMETPRGIEEEIRDQFGLVKEHESVIVVVEPAIREGGNGNRSRGGLLGSVWRGLRGIFSNQE